MISLRTQPIAASSRSTICYDKPFIQTIMCNHAIMCNHFYSIISETVMIIPLCQKLNTLYPGTESSVSGIVRIQARSHQFQESLGSRHGVISLRNRQGPGTDSSVSGIVRVQALNHQSQESSGSRH